MKLSFTTKTLFFHYLNSIKSISYCKPEVKKGSRSCLCCYRQWRILTCKSADGRRPVGSPWSRSSASRTDPSTWWRTLAQPLTGPTLTLTILPPARTPSTSSCPLHRPPSNAKSRSSQLCLEICLIIIERSIVKGLFSCIHETNNLWGGLPQ